MTSSLDQLREAFETVAKVDEDNVKFYYSRDKLKPEKGANDFLSWWFDHFGVETSSQFNIFYVLEKQPTDTFNEFKL